MPVPHAHDATQLAVADACHPGMDDHTRRRRLLALGTALPWWWRVRLRWGPGTVVDHHLAMQILDDLEAGRSTTLVAPVAALLVAVAVVAWVALKRR